MDRGRAGPTAIPSGAVTTPLTPGASIASSAGRREGAGLATICAATIAHSNSAAWSCFGDSSGRRVTRRAVQFHPVRSLKWGRGQVTRRSAARPAGNRRTPRPPTCAARLRPRRVRPPRQQAGRRGLGQHVGAAHGRVPVLQVQRSLWPFHLCLWAALKRPFRFVQRGRAVKSSSFPALWWNHCLWREPL